MKPIRISPLETISSRRPELSHRALLVAVLSVSVCASLPAQSAHAKATLLGLPRLKTTAKAGEAAPLAATKFAVDDLAVAGSTGAGKIKKNGLDMLTLAVGGQWSANLRGAAKDVTFVSFMLYGSQTTIVEVGGARLGLSESPASTYLQLMFDDPSSGALKWKPLGLHIALDLYDGKPLAPLPVLTVRLDPANDTWDLYAGTRLVADNLPFVPALKNQRQIVVKAGVAGAWLTSLVLADENPLYDDANANGIDDNFEKQKRGVLLAANATSAERKTLAADWKTAQRQQPPPPLLVRRPSPDPLPPKG